MSNDASELFQNMYHFLYKIYNIIPEDISSAISNSNQLMSFAGKTQKMSISMLRSMKNMYITYHRKRVDIIDQRFQPYKGIF